MNSNWVAGCVVLVSKVLICKILVEEEIENWKWYVDFFQLYCYIKVLQTLQFYMFTPFFLYNKVSSFILRHF